MHLVRNCDNTVVDHGDTIISFRDEEWQFVRISQAPRIDSVGKIIAKRPDGFQQELYPTVFDCTIATYDL